MLNQDVKITEEFAALVDDFTQPHDSECGVCAGYETDSEEIQCLNASITTDEILKCIREMSNGKAPGIDGVVIEMIKCSTNVTVPYLNHLYIRVLSTGDFPKQWCQAALATLHKKGDKSDPNKYRGIALLSVLGENIHKNC